MVEEKNNVGEKSNDSFVFGCDNNGHICWNSSIHKCSKVW